MGTNCECGHDWLVHVLDADDGSGFCLVVHCPCEGLGDNDPPVAADALPRAEAVKMERPERSEDERS